MLFLSYKLSKRWLILRTIGSVVLKFWKSVSPISTDMLLSNEEKSKAPPMFLCFKVGKPMRKSFDIGRTSSPAHSYTSRGRQLEYWFAVPQERYKRWLYSDILVIVFMTCRLTFWSLSQQHFVLRVKKGIDCVMKPIRMRLYVQLRKQKISLYGLFLYLFN